MKNLFLNRAKTQDRNDSIDRKIHFEKKVFFAKKNSNFFVLRKSFDEKQIERSTVDYNSTIILFLFAYFCSFNKLFFYFKIAK